MSVISVVVADDHPLFLKGISDFLNSAGDISVVGACSDGAQALGAIRRLQPAVAVLNISMRNMSGLEVLTRASYENLPTRSCLLQPSQAPATSPRQWRKAPTDFYKKIPGLMSSCIAYVTLRPVTNACPSNYQGNPMTTIAKVTVFQLTGY